MASLENTSRPGPWSVPIPAPRPSPVSTSPPTGANISSPGSTTTGDHGKPVYGSGNPVPSCLPGCSGPRGGFQDFVRKRRIRQLQLGRRRFRRYPAFADQPVDIPFQLGQARGRQHDDFVAKGDIGPVGLGPIVEPGALVPVDLEAQVRPLAPAGLPERIRALHSGFRGRKPWMPVMCPSGAGLLHPWTPASSFSWFSP